MMDIIFLLISATIVYRVEPAINKMTCATARPLRFAMVSAGVIGIAILVMVMTGHSMDVMHLMMSLTITALLWSNPHDFCCKI